MVTKCSTVTDAHGLLINEIILKWLCDVCVQDNVRVEQHDAAATHRARGARRGVSSDARRRGSHGGGLRAAAASARRRRHGAERCAHADAGRRTRHTRGNNIYVTLLLF